MHLLKCLVLLLPALQADAAATAASLDAVSSVPSSPRTSITGNGPLPSLTLSLAARVAQQQQQQQQQAAGSSATLALGMGGQAALIDVAALQRALQHPYFAAGFMEAQKLMVGECRCRGFKMIDMLLLFVMAGCRVTCLFAA